MKTRIKKGHELLVEKADLNGWWVFNSFRGDAYVKGIKIAFFVDKSTLGKSSYQFLVYTKDAEYPYFKFVSPNLIESDPNKLDVKFADLCRISGTWPKFKVFAKEPKNNITVELEFNAKAVQYWNGGRELLFNKFGNPSKWDVYYSVYDCETKAHFEIKGKSYDYDTIGDYEHLWGMHLPGKKLDRLGYWFYEPLMWNDSYGSVAWQIVKIDGEVYIAEGATTIPDGLHKEFDSCKIDVIEKRYDPATERYIPDKWRVLLSGTHGTLEYIAKGYGNSWSNMYVEAEGEYHNSDGKVMPLKGKGVSEFIMDRYDPVLGRTLRPDESRDINELPGFIPEE